MHIKVLFLLALTFLAATSAIATVAVTPKIPTPASLDTTKTVTVTTGFNHTQPTGDPIDDPIFPS